MLSSAIVRKTERRESYKQKAKGYKQKAKSTTPTKSIVLLSYLNQSAILLAVILSYLNTAYLTADSLRQLVHELNYSRILVRRS